MRPDSINSAAVAAILAEAGESIVMPAYLQGVSASGKADGSIVTETDLQCQQALESRLTALEPAIGFLGEEMSEAGQLACLNSGGRFWCVDPLDGTTNFAAGIPGFALSAALISEGHPILACIHDPVRGETFTATAGGGAFLNGKPIRTAGIELLPESVGYVDFKRLPREIAIRFATERLFRSQRNIGSCALEWAWLAAGRGHFILHGGEKVWDYAAGSLIASEAGCTATNWHGTPFFPATSLSAPVLAACSSPLQESAKQQLNP